MLSNALATPEVRDALRKDSATERIMPLEAFRRYIAEDIVRYESAMTPALLKEVSQ